MFYVSYFMKKKHLTRRTFLQIDKELLKRNNIHFGEWYIL